MIDKYELIITMLGLSLVTVYYVGNWVLDNPLLTIAILLFYTYVCFQIVYRKRKA